MMSETSWGRRKYRTTNWKVYNAALKARGDLTIWLDTGLQWLAPPTGKRGRSQILGKLCKTHESRRGSGPAAVDLVLTQFLR